jgi:hypothetical protein
MLGEEVVIHGALALARDAAEQARGQAQDDTSQAHIENPVEPR